MMVALSATLFSQLLQFEITELKPPSTLPLFVSNPDNAVLVIYSSMKNLTFSSNIEAIDNQRYEENRYVLFLKTERQVITVKSQNFIEGKISVPKMAVKQVLYYSVEEKKKGADILSVLIEADPADAVIYADGKLLGRSGTYTLSEGVHSLWIEKSGYQTVTTDIDVSRHSIAFRYKLSAIELKAVTISSDPTGAEIIIDGVSKGKTNKGLFLFPGTYALQLVSAGYLDLETMLTVSQDADQKYPYKLIRNIAEVEIVLSPPDANVYLNDQLMKPGKNQIAPGAYKVIVSKSGWLSETDVFTIGLNEKIRKSYTLVKNSGSLNLLVEPSDARVLINKEEMTKKNKIELSPGQYKIELSREGYDPQDEMILIERGETISRNYKLTQQQGSLQFLVEPVEASVELHYNGNFQQKWEGIKIHSGIPVGEYSLKVKMNGYKTREEKFSLGKGEIKVIEINLEKGSDIAFPDVVFVKGGWFNMGSNENIDNEKPIHRVWLDDFFIGKFEVTQKEWYDLMGSNPSYFKGENLPVEQVSWVEAQEFINRLNSKTGMQFRLPTEAEWEYAARGGNQSKRYQHSGNDILGEVGWYEHNSSNQTWPVGRKKPNELGIYDMSGNVWEWCSDLFSPDYYKSSPEMNPKGPNSGTTKVVRGGSWRVRSNSCTVSFRFDYSPLERRNAIGFRVVREP